MHFVRTAPFSCHVSDTHHSTVRGSFLRPLIVFGVESFSRCECFSCDANFSRHNLSFCLRDHVKSHDFNRGFNCSFGKAVFRYGNVGTWHPTTVARELGHDGKDSVCSRPTRPPTGPRGNSHSSHRTPLEL